MSWPATKVTAYIWRSSPWRVGIGRWVALVEDSQHLAEIHRATRHALLDSLYNRWGRRNVTIFLRSDDPRQ